MNLCPTCRKLIYRTDACKGVDVECGRTDSGSKKSGGQKLSVSTPAATGIGFGDHASDDKRTPDTSKLIVAVDYGRKDETVELIGKVTPDGKIEVLSLTVRGTPRKRKPKGTFDRKAYQREAARKRRAAQKEAKP